MNTVQDLEGVGDKLMTFSDQDSSAGSTPAETWKVLIVDDDDEIHRVTKLALGRFELHGRELEYFDAYTGREGTEIMRQRPDIALVLMDVVMESEHAGLDAVQAIRNELGNRFVRIILRTGQPGQAPEQEVVRRFDINDYKEKTELTAKKLYTLMHTGLNHYRELTALNRARVGLENVIEASTSIFELRSLARFAHGLLEQLAALLHAGHNAVVVRATGIAATRQDGGFRILAGTGDYARYEGRMAQDVLDQAAMGHIIEAIQRSAPIVDKFTFTAHFPTTSGIEHVVYLNSGLHFEPADVRLVELFCRNVAIAFDNVGLHQEVIDSQQQMLLMLSAAIEERSRELRSHVKRVAEYSVVLGRLCGFDDENLGRLRIAAAMHDLGKIDIPEAILNKPGELPAGERTIMETRVIIGTHHEHWNGSGYPHGLKGEEIHILGRIVAVADVFDALTTTRCYKEPWPMPRVIEYFREQRGRHFEPALVDLFLANLDEVLQIKARLYDANPAPAN